MTTGPKPVVQQITSDEIRVSYVIDIPGFARYTGNVPVVVDIWSSDNPGVM